MVTISSSGEGKCVWCQQEKEGVVAEFPDGLRGHLCWSDFKTAVKVRLNGKDNDKPKSTPTEKEAVTKES